MNHKTILAVLFSAGLAAAGVASAQDRHDDHDNHDKGRDNGHQQAEHHDEHGNDHDRGAGPGHNMHKGEHLRPEYNNKKYVVSDWRGRHLSAPPRGYHWVQAGSDYVLVGIATGVIANLLLNN